MSLIYCERLMQRRPTFAVTPLNVHRLFLALLIVSAKIVNDHYCRNSFFARATRISVQDVNAMELEICYLLGFHLHIDIAEFTLYWDSLARHYSAQGLLHLVFLRTHPWPLMSTISATLDNKMMYFHQDL